MALMAMQASVATTTPDLNSLIPLTPASPGKQFFPGELPTRPPPVLSHLLLNVRAFVGSICSSASEGVELMFALYLRHEHRFLSEFFVVKLNHNGVPAGPRPEDLVGKIQTLFTDLTARDVAEEVYLVCRIFKIGEAKDVLRPGTDGSNGSSKEDRRASLLLESNSRPGSSQTNRLHKVSSSITRSKRVSQIFSRGTSPEAQTANTPTLKSSQSVGNLMSGKTGGKITQCRKPFGCAVLDLSTILQETAAPASTLQESGMDHVMPIFVSVQEHDFHQLHERIIESKTNKLYLLASLSLTVVSNNRGRTVLM